MNTLERLHNITLLERFAQKAIDFKLTGKSEDYSESLQLFYEAKRRMENSKQDTDTPAKEEEIACSITSENTTLEYSLYSLEKQRKIWLERLESHNPDRDSPNTRKVIKSRIKDLEKSIEILKEQS